MSEALDRDLSVIIPTRNRAEHLARCLDALRRQTLPPERFEVLVVDNGSEPSSLALARQAMERTPFRATLLVEPRPGPAAARNRGIENAHGHRILFIGDDILASPQLLAEHLLAAERHTDCAILGFTDWAPDLRVTPFMLYLAPEHGAQFRYATIADPLNCGYQFFYASNISLPRRWLDIERFDETFPYACLEDADLGYRLQKRGLEIVFHPLAMAYHDHLIRFRDFLKRMEQQGEGMAHLYRKFPELRSDPNMIPSDGYRARFTLWRRLRFRAMVWLIALADPLRIPFPRRSYERLLEFQFVRSYFAAFDRSSGSRAEG
ncbi:glycosyltransferase, partial [Candidatus Sumerlaeota bacterium]|nr:glycosyltransferase [Candidatus Sumerlaeota bacterium]